MPCSSSLGRQVEEGEGKVNVNRQRRAIITIRISLQRIQHMQEENVVVQSASLVQLLETRTGCVGRVRCRPALPLIKYEIDSKSARLK